MVLEADQSTLMKHMLSGASLSVISYSISLFQRTFIVNSRSPLPRIARVSLSLKYDRAFFKSPTVTIGS